MSTYKELLAQRQQLDDAIAQARQHELSDAVGRAKALIDEFSLTPADVFGTARKGRESSGAKAKVAPKYQDPDSGKTWSGRGLRPRWLVGKKVEDYLIERP